jgi:hypothetical protein
MRSRTILPCVGTVLGMTVMASPSVGYIHFPPATMQKMCKQSTTIRVLAVKKHDKEKGVIVTSADAFEGDLARVIVGEEFDSYQYGYIDRTGEYVWQPTR